MIYKLPNKYKNTFLLVYAEGLTHSEAGEVLKCSEKTISWSAHNAKREDNFGYRA